MFDRKITFACICALFFIFNLNQDAGCRIRHSKAAVGIHKNLGKAGARKKTPARIHGTKSVQVDKYRVRRGDTLYGIAKSHGVTVADLQAANPAARRNLSAGMILKIPGKKNNAPARKSSVKAIADRPRSNAPHFQWPMKIIESYRRDGESGVRPIGIVIAARPDMKVYTSANGTVKKVGQMRGFGKYVVVKHDHDFMTVYSNLGEIVVKNGDSLDRGDLIGKVSDACILHFQIDCDGKPQNPLVYLPKKG